MRYKILQLNFGSWMMLFLRFTDHLWVSNDVSSPSIRYRAADGDHSDPGSVAPESGWRPTTRCSPHFLTLEPRTPGTCCAMLCYGRIQSVRRNQLHSKSFNCHPRVDHSKSLKGSFWKRSCRTYQIHPQLVAPDSFAWWGPAQTVQ